MQMIVHERRAAVRRSPIHSRLLATANAQSTHALAFGIQYGNSKWRTVTTNFGCHFLLTWLTESSHPSELSLIVQNLSTDVFFEQSQI